MCHIDLNNYFWSLRLLEAFCGAFRILDGEGEVLSFRCLLLDGGRLQFCARKS